MRCEHDKKAGSKGSFAREHKHNLTTAFGLPRKAKGLKIEPGDSRV